MFRSILYDPYDLQTPVCTGRESQTQAQANIGGVDNYYDMKRLCKSTATLSLLVLRAS